MKINFRRLWRYSFGKNKIVPESIIKSLKINLFKICIEIALKILPFFFSGLELKFTRNQELHRKIVDACQWGSNCGATKTISELSKYVLLFCEQDNAYQVCLYRIIENV